MNRQKTAKRIDLGFKIMIIVVLIAGFIGGIVCGNAFKTPTAKALDAAAQMAKHPSIAGLWAKEARETVWSLTSTISMLGVWVSSVFISFFLYVKKHQLKMMDEICNSLIKLEDQNNI